MLTLCFSRPGSAFRYASLIALRKLHRTDSANSQQPSLASGCCFLISGKVADLVGSSIVGLSGCLVMAVSLAAAGGSRTGAQLIIFRALQGLGAAMYLPTNISIWTSAVPKGRIRNLGFACLSFSSPIGLQVGFLLAGAFEQSERSWRWGFWLCAGIMAAVSVLGFAAFPLERRRDVISLESISRDLDLIGMLISVIVLGSLGFALAYVECVLSEAGRALYCEANGQLFALASFQTHHPIFEPPRSSRP